MSAYAWSPKDSTIDFIEFTPESDAGKIASDVAAAALKAFVPVPAP